MPYSPGEITGPFWATDSGIANGRDPLGIQNSSVVTYVKLLPGITNVTSHIRYYGFYCWLLEQYIISPEYKNNNSIKEQLLFIRKAELLLAYIIKSNESEKYNGVAGSAFVDADLKNNQSDFYTIDLKRNADFYSSKQKKVYWKLKSGVFGQYYIGVLKDLNLIIEPAGTNNIYMRTDLGKSLADAFGLNVPASQRKAFLQSILNGSVSIATLTSLQAFHLNNIRFESDEWKLYIEILKGPDRPGAGRPGESTFRRATIHFYLNFLKKNEGEAFLGYAYSQKINIEKQSHGASAGWYYYALNEYAHLSYEHIFCSLLYSLKIYPTDLKNGISDLVNETMDALFHELQLKDEHIIFSKILPSCKNPSSYFMYQMQDSYKKARGICIANSILALIALFLENEGQFDLLSAYALTMQLSRKGNALTSLKELIGDNKDKPIKTVIELIIYRALNDHLYSSYNKARLTQKDVLNILVDETTARRVRDIEPSYTSPRVNMMRNF